ncbi:MAG: glycosyltransferase family 39 protein [Deltaproteobacteria bacterium]|nr:glycosyltransferase family 39 protein [Deltaproteobacteria bacterium]
MSEAATGAARSPRAWLGLAALLVLGLAVRLYYFSIKAGMHYPDEIFQYLEPAYWVRHGDAWLPWEYARGVRNWVLPAYYGSLMTLGEWLGYQGWELHRLLTLHNTLFGLLLIPAGLRLGRAASRGDERVAWLTGLFLAAFPLFGYFGPHTLSELHGLLLTTWAYALWMEQVAAEDREGDRRKAFVVGLLLGGAFVTRYTLLVFVPVVALDYLLFSRKRQFVAATAGFLTMIALLAIVDWITWGVPLHAFIEYVRYNLIEDGASHHGVSPLDFYWQEAFVERLGHARWLLVLPALAFARAHWRMLGGWLLPFVAFSVIRHKEERFLLSIWPFLLVGALVAWFALLDRLPRRRWSAGLATALLLLVCGANFVGVSKMRMRWKAGIFQAQDFVGQQADATGLLLDDRLHLNGGYTLLNRSIPQLQFHTGHLRNRLYNYVAVYEERSLQQMRRWRGFEEVATFEDTTVFRRQQGLVPPP